MVSFDWIMFFYWYLISVGNMFMSFNALLQIVITLNPDLVQIKAIEIWVQGQLIACLLCGVQGSPEVSQPFACN